MAVVCSKCCKFISRYDDSISCTNDLSHIFHINCENLTVQTFEELKTTEEILSCKCEFCCTRVVESVAVQTYMGSSVSYKCISAPTIDSIRNLIKSSMKTYISPILISLRDEISNLKNEILSLKTKNKKLLEVIGQKVSVIKNTTERKNKNHKN